MPCYVISSVIKPSNLQISFRSWAKEAKETYQKCDRQAHLVLPDKKKLTLQPVIGLDSGPRLFT